MPYMGYIGMCHREEYGFQAVYSQTIYKSESLGLEKGIIFLETDQLVEDLWERDNCGIRFCFGWTVLLTLSSFWKTATL